MARNKHNTSVNLFAQSTADYAPEVLLSRQTSTSPISPLWPPTHVILTATSYVAVNFSINQFMGTTISEMFSTVLVYHRQRDRRGFVRQRNR